MWQNSINSTQQSIIRSSGPNIFCKKGALRNFAKFTGKYLCKSLFFNEVVFLNTENTVLCSHWFGWVFLKKFWGFEIIILLVNSLLCQRDQLSKTYLKHLLHQERKGGYGLINGSWQIRYKEPLNNLSIFPRL